MTDAEVIIYCYFDLFCTHWKIQIMNKISLMNMFPRGVGVGGGVLGLQLDTDAWTNDRRKDPKQYVPNFWDNKPFCSDFRETAPC